MGNDWNWLTPVHHPRTAREQGQVSLVGVNADGAIDSVQLAW